MMQRGKAKPKDPGYVYVIAQKGQPGVYKVGRAGNVKRRLQGLQTASPHELVAVRTWRTHNMAQSEKRMHALLIAHHVRGEWHRCPLPIIDMAWRQAMAVRGRALAPEELGDENRRMLAELAADYMGPEGEWQIQRLPLS
jgi:hypothetical protein